MHETEDRKAIPVVVRHDTFSTLLVHAEPGQASTHRVEAAARLARDLGAHLIGVGAETFEPMLMAGPFLGYAGGEWAGLVQDGIRKNIAAAEAAFQRDAAGADVEWRTLEDYPHTALRLLARAADLVVVGPRGRGGDVRTADPADVLLNAGRPILVVPEGRHHLRAQSVVVAWKDTRECRRAIADALPFLQRADDVVVLAVVKPDAVESAAFEVADVVQNLKRHGVEARPLVTAVPREGVTAEIERVARANTADLVVCGGYGHSRTREWAFGGVTDELLHRPACFVLMSH
ncbi:MAG: universal stress protein [Phenylobacterium sp.]|uniref:universal stress protein n=1 Tax=Phenylobacterium sp. TaxID=1871053 RepID=UPI001A5B65A6|nr:universal stress protein [Phenylobacterium sp.]MBL8554833.1 universal stress protein [Phenylobacterium sp.]